MSWLRHHRSFAAIATSPRARRPLRVERLESRWVPAGVLAVGSGPGLGPLVALYHDSNNDGIPDPTPYAVFAALTPYFHGGVHVAVGHFTSATTLDVAVAAGAGGAPRVQIFHLDINDLPVGRPESFLAASAGFRGGLNVAREQTGGAALDSLLVAAAHDRSFVNVYNDGTTINGAVPGDQLLANSKVDSFNVYPPSFVGGVRIAAGRNLVAGAISDFVVAAPGPGGLPTVVVLRDSNNDFRLSDNLAAAQRFMPVEQSWRGGLFVAVGDVGSPSANAELIFGRGPGGPPEVIIFSDTNNNGNYTDDGPASRFLAYDASFHGGVRVAASRLSPAALNLQGDLVVAPASGAGALLPVEVFKAANDAEVGPTDAPLAEDFPFGPTFSHGYFLAFGGNGS